MKPEIDQRDDNGTVTGTSRAPPYVRSVVRSALRNLADLAMPPVCMSCHEPIGDHDAICPACWQQIDFIGEPLCDRLGLPMPFDTGGTMISAAAASRNPAFRKARAAARYDGAMRKLIGDFKFRDHQDARRLFGRWLTTAGRDLITDTDIIVPVPLHRWRLLSRRFNQSAMLARELARITELPFTATALIRSRRTKRQVGLSTSQRKSNVKGAFSVPSGKRSRIAGARVLLIDDVITTGATIEACSQALLKAGAAHVDVLALAMVTDTATVTT